MGCSNCGVCCETHSERFGSNTLQICSVKENIVCRVKTSGVRCNKINDEVLTKHLF